MSLQGISRTAIAAAIARAAHQIFDGDPKLLTDPLALTFVDDATREALRARKPAIMAMANPAARVHFCLRSRIAEDCLARAVAQGVDQYAILGAGLDSFAYRQPAWAHSVWIVEVDHPKTQAFKREWLRSRAVAPPPNVGYLPVDFVQESLIQRLHQAPFDQTRPIFVSWLGVTQYLAPEAVAETLRSLAAWPGGCGLMLTYMLADWSAFTAEARAWFEQQKDGAAAVGEPWLSRYSEAAIIASLRSAGFAAQVPFALADIHALYFSRRTDGLKAVGGPSRIMGAHTSADGGAWFNLMLDERKTNS
jgi:methyltransferase (TIGR00027 family)